MNIEKVIDTICIDFFALIPEHSLLNKANHSFSHPLSHVCLMIICGKVLVRLKSQLVKVISDTTRRVPYNRLTFYPNREVRNHEFKQTRSRIHFIIAKRWGLNAALKMPQMQGFKSHIVHENEMDPWSQPAAKEVLNLHNGSQLISSLVSSLVSQVLYTQQTQV